MVSSAEEIRLLNEKIAHAAGCIDRVREAMSKVIVGQNEMTERLLVGLLSNGHILLEGVPGLAKTLAIKSLAQTIQAHFSRIQFTPDLLPADVIGTMMYNPQRGDFVVKRGPVFAHFVLADEINRAPAKVQSALLEAMQERQVTIGDHTYRLEDPFLVLATQNPLEQEGTYPLPEAQSDRFMLKVLVDYPTMEEEQEVLRRYSGLREPDQLSPVAAIHEVQHAKELTRQIYLDPKIEQYILDIVFATRYPQRYGLNKLQPVISYGGSPRATLNIALAAKAIAFMDKRGYVVPEDVRTMVKDVLRHRIGLTYEAAAENISADQIIDQVLQAIKVP